MPSYKSSFSENPLLRVSRPVSACSRCRAAKVKCDGKLPACTACEKAGREGECSAANDQFARGKERSYVAALELRVEKLEKRLAYAQSRKASVALHEQDIPPTDQEADRKDSLATIRAAIHRKAARKRENSDINSLVSDFGYLSVNATTRDFEPSATNMTFARLVLAASTNDPLPDLEDPLNLPLPPRQTAYSLIQYYMSHVYIFYPAFPETALLPVLNDVYQENQLPIRSSEFWLLWMVLAIGSIAQSRSTTDDFYNDGVLFVARALLYADRALIPGYSSQIRSLVLLTQYAMLDPAHFDSWSLIGFTSRAAIDLGFHQDPPLTQSVDKAALDARRKLFYCVYSLDRSISMVHAREFSFTDEAISVSLPSASSMQTTVPNAASMTGQISADCALPMFQLRRIQSHWYQTLFQSDPADPLPDATSFIWQKCHEMRDWERALPASLPPGIREIFDIELRYSYVYCIAPSARAPHMTPYGRTLIFEHAIAFLDRMYDMATAPTATTLYSYHDALRVYFMGSQFVAVLRDAGDTLLAGVIPVSEPLARPGKPPPPPLPSRAPGAGDNLASSLRCLERVSLTLGRFGERWENALALQSSFDERSAEVLDDLKARREMRAAAPPQQPQPQSQSQSQQSSQPQLQNQLQHGQMAPPSQQAMQQTLQGRQQQQQQQQQHQPLHEVKWIDVDVAQIIRGGGQI